MDARTGTDAASGREDARVRVRLGLNGRAVDAWIAPHETLLAMLRDALGATEVKYGCGEGVCGTCTVLVDGAPVNACLMLGVQVDGTAVTTVRGLTAASAGPGGPASRAPSRGAAAGLDATAGHEGARGLHPLQRAFLAHEAAQCGFCTPGMLLTAYAFLREHPRATRDQIRAALAGNLCRCTGYTRIVDAVEAYAREMRPPARGTDTPRGPGAEAPRAESGSD